MGDDEQGGAAFGLTREQQVHDLGAGGGIQIARRFIGKEQLRARGQGSGNRHALLFPAR